MAYVAPQMIGAAVQAVQPSQMMSPSGGGYGAPGGGGGGASSFLGMLGFGNPGGPGAPGSLSGLTTDMINAQNARAMASRGGNNALIGNIGMGLSAASMANRFGAGIPGVGVASDVMGIYSGIKRGGVMGYGGAAMDAAQLANMAGAGIPYLGPAGAALSTYNAVKSWQSGKTGADALAGAEAGASWGSLVGPVGTVVGAVIGGAVGALSSAFGGGTTSQEGMMSRGLDAQTASMNNQQRMQIAMSMRPDQSIQTIQGYMNAHDNSAGHSEQIEQVFGKNGVSNMVGQMLPAINKALAKDPSLRNLSPQDLYTKVAAPWLKSKGATINPNTRDVKGNPEGQNLIDAVTGFIGAWQGGMVNSKTSLGVGGQTINIPTYGG